MRKLHSRSAAALVALAATMTGCGSADQGEAIGHSDDDLVGGNGSSCAESIYNCKLRASGGNRTLTKAGDDTWAVTPGAAVLDGDGRPLAIETGHSMSFNWGQERVFGGKHYVFAMATSNGSSGWFPLADVQGESSLSDETGHVSAHGAGLREMGCYEIRSSSDASIELKKVVYDTTASHERAGDYLPLVRANGKRSANLTFNVPGFSLGGVAIDHFVAGTKFRRLEVPTQSGSPSIDIPLWSLDGAGRYRKHDGSLKFVYGYVVAATGTKRVGWMAYPALETSTGCP